MVYCFYGVLWPSNNSSVGGWGVRGTGIALCAIVKSSGHVIRTVQRHFGRVAGRFIYRSRAVSLALPSKARIVFSVGRQVDGPSFVTSRVSNVTGCFSRIGAPLIKLGRGILLRVHIFGYIAKVAFSLGSGRSQAGCVLGHLFRVTKSIGNFLLCPDVRVFANRKGLLFSTGNRDRLARFVPIKGTSLLSKGCRRRARTSIREHLHSVTLLRRGRVPCVRCLHDRTLRDRTRLEDQGRVIRHTTTLFTITICSRIVLSKNSKQRRTLFCFGGVRRLCRIRSCLSPTRTTCVSGPSPRRRRYVLFK